MANVKNDPSFSCLKNIWIKLFGFYIHDSFFGFYQFSIGMGKDIAGTHFFKE